MPNDSCSRASVAQVFALEVFNVSVVSSTTTSRSQKDSAQPICVSTVKAKLELSGSNTAQDTEAESESRQLVSPPSRLHVPRTKHRFSCSSLHTADWIPLYSSWESKEAAAVLQVLYLCPSCVNIATSPQDYIKRFYP
ncbi:hypothetical protein R3I93_018704 [Phoxinus phoxinus]|uniref:Uncharacterized protein n=1 Tax=Phoxinus phoxinus TaxID=58324 RepID=A0AAN9GV95_9TELE